METPPVFLFKNMQLCSSVLVPEISNVLVTFP